MDIQTDKKIVNFMRAGGEKMGKFKIIVNVPIIDDDDIKDEEEAMENVMENLCFYLGIVKLED